MKIYFDGSARPNPGPIRTVVVAGGRVYPRDYAEAGDNNDAEWLALLHAVEVARSLGIVNAALLGDSAMVVNQVQGGRLPPRFRQRFEDFRRLAAGFEDLRVRRIERSQNLAGIALERIHEESARACRG